MSCEKNLIKYSDLFSLAFFLFVYNKSLENRNRYLFYELKFK